MKKSNVLIIAIAVVASIFLLWLWYFLRFNLVDNPLDLVLSIVWWILVILAVVFITRAEKKRQEAIRTAYVGKGMLFNAEAGMVPVAAGAGATQAIQRMLEGLEYGFDKADMPEDPKPVFDFVVRSAKFADEGDTWEGEVVNVANPNGRPKAFSSKQELMAIIG